ncbi:Uncharacterized protein APZ42_001577 [Daphnia magna]|uniref:Uncharacterized protein n=1 Tax=Daphnia magna TaxID=35525 RepID=A0A164IVZ8_9CRUS|nr:Uncharacterized protein APZ42_001577 [Daphnia magna]
MSSVRGNSKSSARRMRLNLADGNYSEMMEWNTTETLKNQSMEECQTRMGEEDTNSTIGDMNSSNVSVHNNDTTKTFQQSEDTESMVDPCWPDAILDQRNVIIFQPTEGLQVPGEFQLMSSTDTNFCEEDQCKNQLDNDLIHWSTNDLGESEDDDDNDILVILVISMMK